MKLRYTPAAMMDLEEIKSYIADTLLNPDAAANLMAGIAAACALLKDQPLPGPELRHILHREIDERTLDSQEVHDRLRSDGRRFHPPRSGYAYRLPEYPSA